MTNSSMYIHIPQFNKQSLPLSQKKITVIIIALQNSESFHLNQNRKLYSGRTPLTFLLITSEILATLPVQHLKLVDFQHWKTHIGDIYSKAKNLFLGRHLWLHQETIISGTLIFPLNTFRRSILCESSS